MSAIARLVAEVPAVRYVKEETMPCGQRISALLATREIGDVPHFIGVLGGAGGHYILDELARGALGTMPACELTDIHVTMVAACRRRSSGSISSRPDVLLHAGYRVPNYDHVNDRREALRHAVVSLTLQREPWNVARSRTGYRGRPGFDGDCEAARGMPRCRTL